MDKRDGSAKFRITVRKIGVHFLVLLLDFVQVFLDRANPRCIFQRSVINRVNHRCIFQRSVINRVNHRCIFQRFVINRVNHRCIFQRFVINRTNRRCILYTLNKTTSLSMYRVQHCIY